MPSLALLIDNIKMIKQFLDFIEEIKHLFVQEWNFRDIILQKLQAHLKQDKLYGKQRGQIKWATCGDARLNSFMTCYS
jgi:hypothetical protein